MQEVAEKFKRSKYGKDKTLLKESDVLMTKLENELVKSKDIYMKEYADVNKVLAC